MGTPSNGLWLQLGNTSIFTTLLPLAIGGLLAHFKPFLANEDDIRNRVNSRREALFESVCKSLHRVLTQVLTIPGPAQLRGAPPNEPDIIGDYVNETFRIFATIQQLDVLHRGVKQLYTCLYVTAAIGMVSFIFALSWDDSRPYVAVLCWAAVVIQIFCVGAVRWHAKQLENYERTT